MPGLFGRLRMRQSDQTDVDCVWRQINRASHRKAGGSGWHQTFTEQLADAW